MENKKIERQIDDLKRRIDQAWTEGKMSSFKQMSDTLYELVEQHKVDDELATAHNNLGLYYNRFGNYDRALKHFFAAMELSLKHTGKSIRSTAYTNIGMTYASMRNTEKSLEYCMKAYQLNPDSCELNLVLGFAHKEMKEYAKAVKYYERAEELAKEAANKKLLSWSLLYSATTNAILGKVEESNRKLADSLSIAKTIGDAYQIGCILYQQAINLKQNNDFDQAIAILNEMLDGNKENDNSTFIKFVYAELADAYKRSGDMVNAYKCKDMQLEISEKIFHSKISDKVHELQENHKIELEVQEKLNEKIRREKYATEQKLAEFKKAYSNVTGIGQVGIFSSKMKEIVKLAEFFHHDRNVPVLIEGATGTGKEIIARIVHYGKEESQSPFIILNCSAISESLFESELFGYEEGAFTGARKTGMIGKMELAQGGTLFLDEIGELPISLQPKLLRALQQREITRIGGSIPVKLDVRIICATNRNLAQAIEHGNFREDLYYRLNTGKILIPPLTERKEEIAPLAQVFLMEFAKEKKKSFRYIENEAIKLMEMYDWPGNVRELRNVIERATLLYDDYELKTEYIDFLNSTRTPEQLSRKIVIDFPEEGMDFSEIERRVFKKGLEICEGNKAKLAKLLNISAKTIYRRKL